jgi:peptidoglycan hydrolase-like protein with peptidoglycan-binding domain
MSITASSSKPKAAPKSPQLSQKTQDRKKESKPQVNRNTGSGVGGSVGSGRSNLNGNASGTSRVRDSSSVSQEAKQEATSSGSLESLLSGLDQWSESSAQERVQETQSPAGAADPTAAQAGTAEQTPAQSGAADQTADANAQSLSLGQNELLGSGRNSSPEQVTQLQEMLNAQGGQLDVDGKFGPRTEEAVRNFQRENNLEIDGVVGPETQAALNGGDRAQETEAPDAEQRPPAAPGELGQLSLADPNMSPAEQYEHYQRLIEANGGEINTDGATVLGMRGLGTDGQRHDGTSNVGGYDDSFVVLNRDADGNPTVEVFRGATHANQRSSGSSFGPDANGNNITGVAMLAPGNYSVEPHSRNYQGNRGPSYHVRTLEGQGYVPAFRDRNADGTISANERTQAEQGGYQASDILFHAGRNNAPSSIGCQTMPPELMRAFSNAVGFDGFNYTLLDANNSQLPVQ